MTLAVSIYIVICILAVIIFLLQQTETGGMGIIGGSSNSLLGATRTTFLAKVATFFAVLFFISALFLSILSSGRNNLFQSENLPEVDVLESKTTEILKDEEVDSSADDVLDQNTSVESSSENFSN